MRWRGMKWIGWHRSACVTWSSPHLPFLYQLQFSEVLIKWRRFFHQLAADQGKAGLAAVEIELEVEKLQVSYRQLSKY